MKLTPQKLYKKLLEKFGEQKWWPMDKNYHQKNHSDPRFEIMIGAVLTQNTAWGNVEKALTNLKIKKMLDIKRISEIDKEALGNMIKSSGFFNQKAERLKGLFSYLDDNYNGNLDAFFKKDIKKIREELLSLKGIGPETADSILLYAGNLPIFVIDTYTKRLCRRLPIDVDITYYEIQNYFEKELCKHYSNKELTRVYNELHALIVSLAKKICKKKPECYRCPLDVYCLFKKNKY